MADDQNDPGPAPAPPTPEADTGSMPPAGKPVDPQEARHADLAREAQERSERSAFPPPEERVAQQPGDGMEPDADHPDPTGSPVAAGTYSQEERAERGAGKAGDGEPGRVPSESSIPPGPGE